MVRRAVKDDEYCLAFTSLFFWYILRCSVFGNVTVVVIEHLPVDFDDKSSFKNCSVKQWFSTKKKRKILTENQQAYKNKNFLSLSVVNWHESSALNVCDFLHFFFLQKTITKAMCVYFNHCFIDFFFFFW